jgi:hypothetical protein
MAADIRDSSAMLVWFNHGGGWFVLPSVDEIRGYVPLRCVAREADGEVYAALGDTESAR